MKLIIGLGNPGKEYENTRHNVGYRVLDKIAAEKELRFHKKDDFFAEVVEASQDGEKILLVKPLTFMTDSGRAVGKIADYFKVEPKDVWVVADDIDLPVGTIRVRLEGSSGGHNGIKSIIEVLSSENFPRIRVGIGEARQIDLKEFEHYQPSLEAKEFVLSPFDNRELAIVNPAIHKAAQIIIETLDKKTPPEAHTYEIE
jgi:PTH1 family peptidyl-tRNA hydrolase